MVILGVCGGLYEMKRARKELFNLSKKIKSFWMIFVRRDPIHIAHFKWKLLRGERTLRYNYPGMTKDSIVFDLGGYKGDFAKLINIKYGCKVFVFEPHYKFYNKCEKNIGNIDNIKVFNFGLAASSYEASLYDNEDASSATILGDDPDRIVSCEMVDFFEFIKKHKINQIDLIKINIEGGEYDLLDYIFNEENGLKILNYQIQFHNFIENSELRRKSISEKLKLKYDQKWCFDFVWEGWQLKSEK